MRILLSVDPEIPVPPKLYGGIERIVDGLASELRARDYKVGLIAHPDSTSAVSELFPWPGRVSGHLSDSCRNTCALRKAVRKFQPDVVHSFSRLAYLLPLLLSRQSTIMSYQRHTGGRKLRLMSRLGGRRFAFTGCSEYIAGLGRRVGGDWTAIPNFVDTEFYRFAAQVPLNAPLVFLSRVEAIKGAHTAIAIAQRAGRRLIIAGNRVDSEAGREYWSGQVEPHLRSGEIEYVGPVNDTQKIQLLGNAVAMLVPIEWGEPFGIVFAEALACGTPVIACPLGALPEIVKNGEHGFLVTSIEEGVAAVSKLNTISRAACRLRAETLFSRQVVTSQYEALYRRVNKGAGA